MSVITIDPRDGCFSGSPEWVIDAYREKFGEDGFIEQLERYARESSDAAIWDLEVWGDTRKLCITDDTAIARVETDEVRE